MSRRELLPRQAGRLEDWNQQSRDFVARIVAGLSRSIVPAPGPGAETQEQDNGLLLLAGEHGGLRLDKSDSRVAGVPGTTIARRVLVRAHAEFDGIQFASQSGSDNVALSLVDVSATSTAVFRGCRFTRQTGDSAAWVTVANGGKVHFLGCVFDGQPGNSNVIDNAGAAGNVGVWASNRTGRPIGAATSVIFLTT